MIVEPECREGFAVRVETVTDDGSVDMLVEPGSSDSSVSVINLSSCRSMARSSVGPFGLRITIAMSFLYAR